MRRRGEAYLMLKNHRIVHLRDVFLYIWAIVIFLIIPILHFISIFQYFARMVRMTMMSTVKDLEALPEHKLWMEGLTAPLSTEFGRHCNTTPASSWSQHSEQLILNVSVLRVIGCGLTTLVSTTQFRAHWRTRIPLRFCVSSQQRCYEYAMPNNSVARNTS